MLWRNRIYFQGEGAGGGGGGDGGTGGGSGGAGGDGGTGGGDKSGGGGGGGGGATWRDTLPENYRAHPGLTKFKDVPALAEGYINAEKLVGADKIVLPGKDAKPEERDAAMAAIFDKLGRPKTPDEYQFPEVKDRPYTDADKALQKGFAPIAHKLGLTQSQVAGIAEFQTQLALAGIAAQTKALGESEAGLRKEWGDKYDENLEKGNVAVEAILNKAKVPLDQWKQLKLSDGSFLGDNPLMIKLFATIGDSMGETPYNGDGGTGKGDPFASPAAAKAELERLKAGPLLEKDHPYKNKRHPDHKTWSKRVMDLQSLASQATAK